VLTPRCCAALTGGHGGARGGSAAASRGGVGAEAPGSCSIWRGAACRCQGAAGERPRAGAFYSRRGAAVARVQRTIAYAVY
jgi:hypothetical protein